MTSPRSPEAQARRHRRFLEEKVRRLKTKLAEEQEARWQHLIKQEIDALEWVLAAVTAPVGSGSKPTE